jgi:CDP-alcohol phosphatidyltransferase
MTSFGLESEMGMATGIFAGDKKEGVSILHRPEEKLKAALLPLVPVGIETYHLTLTTIVWSVLVVLFSWLATFDRQWMWGASVMIVAQYVTDLLDGAIGRQRDTGLVKWGFYMDHFLDYIFLCAMLIGWSLLMPDNMKYVMFFVMAVICAFMVNSFLQFAATNRFRIAYWGIGPTEVRIGFIAINTMIIYLNRAAGLRAVPFILAAASFGLLITAYNTQRQLWKIDMDLKAEQQGKTEAPGVDTQGLMIRHFLMSFLIASVAFLALVVRIGAPFHRIVAGVVYAASWIPLIVATVRMRPAHQAAAPNVRRVRTFIYSALILVICAWAALELRPPVAGDGADVTQTIRGTIKTDAETLIEFDAALSGILAGDSSITLATADLAALARIVETHEAYHLIDIHADPKLHAESFLVWYAGLALRCNAGVTLHGLASTDGQTIAVRQDQNRLLAAAVLPNTLLKVGFASSYLRLLQSILEDTTSGDIADLRAKLLRITGKNVESYHAKLQSDPELVIDAAKALEYLP